MGHAIRMIAAGAAAFALQGCLAKTAVDVATLPVKVASSGVDLATTSQAEADQKRGREIRQREEKLGRLQRDYDKQIGRCGDRRPRAGGGALYACLHEAAASPKPRIAVAPVPADGIGAAINDRLRRAAA